jgi:localization factor PodJL
MAYGASWRSKGYDLDPRDVVEEAARAAGLSVEEWLETAADSAFSPGAQSRYRRKNRGAGPDQDYDSPLSAIARRLERRGGRSNRDDGNLRDNGSLKENQVARIVSDAMESFEESLRANEERTAAALMAFSRNGPRASDPASNQVKSMIGNLERGLTNQGAHQGVGHSDRSEKPATPDYSSLTRQLESRIENVLGVIEAKAQASQAALQPLAAEAVVSKNIVERSTRDLRSTAAINAALAKVNSALRGLEQSPQQTEILKTLRSLDQRLTGIEQSPQNNPELIGQMVGEMAALNQHVSVQRPNVDLSTVNRHMNALGERIEALSQNVRAQPAQSTQAASQFANQFSSQFERLTGEVSELRTSMKVKNTGPDAGIETLRRQMATMGDRLDGLTQKIVALRMNGGDFPPPKSIDGDIDELKRLIQTSHAPVNDERVLLAIQSLEQKIGMVERAPTELSARLDRIQSMIVERPVASLPPHVETMLQGLASRLKDFDGSQQDDVAFARLHEEIQMISRKIEQTPAAMANPAFADVSGLERSVSAILQQFDGLKADMGSLAEHAARKATQEALSHITVPSHVAPTDLSGVEQSIQNLYRQIDGFKSDVGQLAEHAAQKATQEAFSRMPVAAAAMPPDLSGIEQSIQGLFRQMDAWKADIGMVAEDAARRVTSEAMRQAPAFAAQTGAPETAELHRALGDMQISQKDAERRTTQTLEAVHDTLKRVVDRLVDMEKDIEQKSLLPATVLQTVSPEQIAHDAGRKPLNIQVHAPSAKRSAPEIQMDVPLNSTANPLATNPLPSDNAPVWNTTNPVVEGAAATVAAMRAQRLGVTTPTVTTTAPTSKGALGAALAAARDAVSGIRMPVGKKTPQASSQNLPAQALPALGADPFDMPLEPGSGRPQKDAGQDLNDPKAKFLAAARQAAQAAAGHAADALETGKQGNTDLKSKVSGLKKRHALLLGLAALIVVVGVTLQFTGMPRLLGGGAKPKEIVGNIDNVRKQIQLSHLARKNSGESEAETSRLPPRQILAEIQEPPLPDALSKPVRSVDVARLEPKRPTGVLASGPEQKINPDASSDPVIVGSLGPTIQSNIRPSVTLQKSAVVPSNDPLFKFEGLKDALALKAAARNGDVGAFVEIGNRFADGRGAARDPRTAALWFERAAEQGSAPARYRLGALYREGKGVDRNPKLALAHFLGAAELGNARAMHNTAVLMAEGVNGAPDYGAATEWFKRAAEYGIRDSQFNLAILYARGLGVTQDLVASYNWFAAAARQGDEDAIKKRDEVASRLSPDQLKLAKDVAAIWKSKTPDLTANEAPVPPGGWDAPAKTSLPLANPSQKRG